MEEPKSNETVSPPSGKIGEISNAASTRVALPVSNLREDYYNATGTLSDNVRSLCFAGIAIIWIFKTGDKNGGIAFSKALLWPLGIFVAALVSDVAQYLWKSIVLRRYLEKCNLEMKTDTEDSGLPSWIHNGTDFFFYSKVVLMAVGYILLLVHITKNLLDGK